MSDLTADVEPLRNALALAVGWWEEDEDGRAWYSTSEADAVLRTNEMQAVRWALGTIGMLHSLGEDRRSTLIWELLPDNVKQWVLAGPAKIVGVGTLQHDR